MERIRNLHPAWIAGCIALTVVLWLATGLFKSKPDTETSKSETAEQGENKLVRVEVSISEAVPVVREAIVSARTAPVRSVKLRAQTRGRVAEIVAKRGSLVEKDAVIARLALDERAAQLRQARAVLKQRQLQYEAAQRLRKDDYMTEVELAQTKANLEIAKAEHDRISKDIGHTVIRAPFAGLLDRRPLEVGDYVQVGDEVGYIIEQDPFVVRGSVSEDDVAELETGQSGSVKLLNGETRQGTLRYIAGEADEQTRTYAVELEVPNPGGRLIAGASAELRLPLEEVIAHELEPATLTLNEAGDFGIKSVDGDNRVHFHKAEVVSNEAGRVWLSKLPPRLRIITVGQGFVSDGDKVEVAGQANSQTTVARP